MSKTAKQILSQYGFKGNANLIIAMHQIEHIMEEYAKAYHTAKLEEVSGLPNVNYLFPLREDEFERAGAEQMRSIAQSVIAKKDKLIAFHAEESTKRFNEIFTLKAEIANLKEANTKLEQLLLKHQELTNWISEETEGQEVSHDFIELLNNKIFNLNK